MLLAHGTVVAVADGRTLHLYRNGGTDSVAKLSALPTPALGEIERGVDAHHRSSAGNPDDSRLDEDGFAAATAHLLNRQALENEFDALVVIADPRTLGELRKHWHKALLAKLTGELAKNLTGHSIADIEAAVAKLEPAA